MADDEVILNANHAPFVQGEEDSGESDIFAGSLLTRNSSGNVVKNSGEAATGHGLIADFSFDPDKDKDEDLTGGSSGERIRYQSVPVGGKVEARLAAGGDLTTAANANVTEGDLLVETDLGALANFDSAETSGTPEGAVYVAQESVDNSGASAGVDNQVYIEATRIA